MDYYMQFRPKRESDIIDYEKEIIVCMANPAYKKMIKNKFKSRKKGILTYKELWYAIVSCILHGNSNILTVDELLEYLWYSRYTKNNNIENKWREKYENKIYNTVNRRFK
tara:strand:- start:3346 stop:3675 length:330 start_codon:yes stop_codon:yes gene_type:complete